MHVSHYQTSLCAADQCLPQIQGTLGWTYCMLYSQRCTITSFCGYPEIVASQLVGGPASQRTSLADEPYISLVPWPCLPPFQWGARFIWGPLPLEWFLQGGCWWWSPHYCIVLFCSYGSPFACPVSHTTGTPLALHDAACISLWPWEGSIGILLIRSEYNDVVLWFEQPVGLEPDLQNLIFEWLAGHVGAVIELLHIISNQVSLPCECHDGFSCLCFSTLFPREYQNPSKGQSSHCKIFMMKTLFISSYRGFLVDLLGTAFHLLGSSQLDHAWWQYLKTCSSVISVNSLKTICRKQGTVV